MLTIQQLTHKEWRKIAKKERRRKIRRCFAESRDLTSDKERELRNRSPSYQCWLTEQQALESFKTAEEINNNNARNAKWLQDEIVAQQNWRELQMKIKAAREIKAKQNLRIKQEWDEEQARLKKIIEAKEKIQQQKQEKYDILMQQIEHFINDGGDLPAEINIPFETNPLKPLCPFFIKTGVCRFGDRCSRNHRRPGISKVLLLPHFYTHFGIEQCGTTEYDSDVLLEYEDSETYEHFKIFFNDVLPEFKKCGKVVQFKTCSNSEPHLRGNVYIEYETDRDAVRAYKKFQGRWYGGKQLNVEFSGISSWRNAICGLFFKKTCPKGRSCNFLHVFRNPGNLFHLADKDHHKRKSMSRSRSRSTSPSTSSKIHKSRDCETSNRKHIRNCRWSESPEHISLKSLRVFSESQLSRGNEDLIGEKRKSFSPNANGNRSHSKDYHNENKRNKIHTRRHSNSSERHRRLSHFDLTRKCNHRNTKS